MICLPFALAVVLRAGSVEILMASTNLRYHDHQDDHYDDDDDDLYHTLQLADGVAVVVVEVVNVVKAVVVVVVMVVAA